MKETYTVAEVAKKFNRSIQTVRIWIKKGSFGKENEGWKYSVPAGMVNTGNMHIIIKAEKVDKMAEGMTF